MSVAAMNKELIERILNEPENEQLIHDFIHLPKLRRFPLPRGILPSSLSRRISVIATTNPGSARNITVDGTLRIPQITWSSTAFVCFRDPIKFLVADGKLVLRTEGKISGVYNITFGKDETKYVFEPLTFT